MKDRVLTVKLVTGGLTLNMISAYGGKWAWRRRSRSASGRIWMRC